MASVIVTSAATSLNELATPAGKTKLKDGMKAFGERFEQLYTPGDDSVLLESFVHVLNTLNYKVYAINPRKTGSELLELSNPVFNSAETEITFEVVGITKKFRILLRDDQRFKMNVSMPVFADIYTYLGIITNIIQDDPSVGGVQPLPLPDANKFLLATSLISRCR